MKSIAVVACCYRLTPEEMATRLQPLLASSATVTGFAVSSRITAEQALPGGWTALPSDNLDFDFSTYLTGLAAVTDRGFGDRPVLFVNDTLFTDHSAAGNLRALLRHLPLVEQLELPAMAGKGDRYTTICLRNPWSGLDRYITSFCFLVNAPALPVFRQLRDFAEADGVTHAHDVDSPAWGANLPGAFRQFMKANLVYAGSPYLWYRLRQGSYSPAQLRSKARSIYFEQRLSGAIGELGCLLPVNAGPRWGTYLMVREWLSRLRRRLWR